MSGPVTGTAMLATVVLTTLPAAPAASSVARSRRSWGPTVAVLMVTCPVGGGLGLVAAAVVAAAAVQGGSPVTGYALGLAATSITLLAGWNALDATRLGIQEAILPFKSGCRRVSSSRYYEFSIYMRKSERDNELLIRPNQEERASDILKRPLFAHIICNPIFDLVSLFVFVLFNFISIVTVFRSGRKS